MKNKATKFISSLIIISILIPSVLLSKPREAKAFGPVVDFITEMFTGISAPANATTGTSTTISAATAVKNVAKEILKSIVMAIEKRLLAQMTKSMVNWINSGFHGAPLFVQNPESFFRDIGKYEIKNLINEVGYDTIGQPFGRGFALDLINSYKRTAQDNAQYTLSKVIRNQVFLRRYRDDFNFGGWNGFLINTQYPQNNYLGYRMLETERLARKLEGTFQNKTQIVRTALQQGAGFLSPETCADNNGSNEYNKTLANQFQRPSFNEAEYNRTHPWKPPNQYDDKGFIISQNPNYDTYKSNYEYDKELAKAEWAKKNTCKNLVATTPGTVVASQITRALNSNFFQTELGAAVGSSMSAIFDALLAHFLDQGLSSLATKVNPPPPRDDFTYEGQTLGSPEEDANAAWNSGPDEPVVLEDFKKQIEGKTVVKDKGEEVIAEIVGNASGKTVVLKNTIRSKVLSNLFDINTTLVFDTTGGVRITENSTATEGTYELVPGDITNTQYELALMDSADPNNPYTTISPDSPDNIYKNLTSTLPEGCTSTAGYSNKTEATPCSPGNAGITQMISKIWPKIRELDMCLPGPNLGWKDRLIEEMDRNSQKIQEKASDQNGEKAAAAQLVFKELQFAVKGFKDWVNNKMITELPDSLLYMDAVDEINNLHQQSDELTSKRRTKSQTLARLQAIKLGLDAFTDQPDPGTDKEKTLIKLKQQYNAIKYSISSATTIEDTKNELTVSIDQYYKMNRLKNQCLGERTTKGWGTPGGADSTFSNGKTEQAIFCDDPIKGGYNHQSFTHANDNIGSGGFWSSIINVISGTGVGPIGGGGVGETNSVNGECKEGCTHPDVPYVNAKNVLSWNRVFGILGRRRVNIELSCNIIFRTNVVDYKKDLPGLTNVTEPAPPPLNDVSDGTETLGTCTVTDPDTFGITTTTTTQNNCYLNSVCGTSASQCSWTANSTQ